MLLTTLSWLLQTAATVPQVQADSRLRREASEAQARFERVRRANLPRQLGSSGSSECDARIGRFCYWYDSTQRNPAPEPQRITSARNALLALLASALARNPSDGWIAGQRVRYLIEAKRPQEAIDATVGCQAERWWCSALQGLALHTAQHYAVADSAFARALREMPARQRCEWLDLRLVAPDRLAKQFSRDDCESRELLAGRLWRLSQPLWSVPGNDLRTEHFSRLTMATILERAEYGHDIPWGSDSRELLLRYGWSEWFTRHDAPTYSMQDARVTGHDREPSYYFFPSLDSIGSRLDARAWRLREAMAPSRYAPRHIDRLTELPHQLTRITRGDSMWLLANFQPNDTAIANDSVNARIVALVGEKLVFGDVSTDGRSARLMVPKGPLVMSVEVLGVKSKHAARARYDVAPTMCESECLADLLLFRPAEASDTTLERALLLALRDLRHSVRDPLGIYWELDRTVGDKGTAWVSLTMTPVRVGRLRRFASKLHLAPQVSPVQLRWQSILDGTRAAGSVSVRLPAAARGPHRVVLTIQADGSPPVRTEREVVLTP